MPKIVTVTFNPAIDKSTTIPALMPEKKLRCTPPTFEPGGGGLNVARAVRKLGGEALAVYFAGGYSGKFLNQLMEQEGVSVHPIEISKHTRENMIVFDKSTGQQYRFGMPGSEVKEEEWQRLLQFIEACDAEFIVASGSLPPGVPDSIFGQVAAIAKRKGARMVIDTSSSALKEAVDEGVYLLKPNLGELSSLAGKEELDHEAADEIAKDIIRSGGCEVIVISMGSAGARLVTKNLAVQIIPPVVRRLSTVGAGDSMVAGIILSLEKGWNIKEAVQYGVAAGTAATLNPGTELCKKEDVERLFKIISGK